MNSTHADVTRFGAILYAVWAQLLLLLRRFLQGLDRLLQSLGPQERKAKAEERPSRQKPEKPEYQMGGLSGRDQWRREEWRTEPRGTHQGSRRLVLDHLPPLKDPQQVTALVAEAASPLELFELLEQTMDLQCFNAINAAAVFSKLAKFSSIDDSMRSSCVPEKLAVKFRTMLQRGSVQVRSASNTFWAVAKLQFQIPIIQDILTAPLMELIETKADDMNERDVVNVMYSCAQLHRREEHRWRPMIRAVMARVPSMAPNFSCGRVVSGLLWSTANLLPKAPELTDLVQLLVSSALARRDFDTLGICHLAWSVSKLATYEPTALDIMPMVSELILANRRLFAADQVVMILISAARLSCMAEHLREVLPELVKAARRCSLNFRQKDIASLVWASTKLNCPDLSGFAAELEKQHGQRPQRCSDFLHYDDAAYAPPVETELHQ